MAKPSKGAATTKKRKAANIRADIRDARIPGKGRVSISLGTTDPKEAVRREDSVRQLIEDGQWDILERLRLPNKKPNALHIDEVHAAVREGDTARLRTTDVDALTLGREIDRMKRTKRATRTENTQDSARSVFIAMERHWGVRRDAEGKIAHDVPMETITIDECAAFLHGPKETTGNRPWAAGTQSVAKAYAAQLWKVAIAREAERAEIHEARPRLTRSPWKHVEAAPDRGGRVAWLRPEEWRVVAGKTEGLPALTLLGLGCLAGLRMSEALYLRPGIDVDMDKRVLHVQPREGLHAWHPKTKRSVRTVPMGDELHRILAHQLEHYSGSRYLIRSPPHDKPMHPGMARKRVMEAFAAAGIKYGRDSADALTMHSLRHTYASWLAQSGVSVLIIAKLIGDTVEQVVKTYAHLIPENLAEAVQHIDSMITKGS